MSSFIFPIEPLRKAFSVLPEQAHSLNKLIDIRYFYVPPSHTKALQPDNVLVVGIRGAGKSEWWLELQDERRRKLVSELSPRTGLSNTECSAGFGSTNSGNYPSKKVFASLLKTTDAKTIWNVIVVRNILQEKFDVSNESSWQEKVSYYQDNFEQLDNQLVKIDNELYAQNKKHIVLFDALDRIADDWDSLKNLLKGLLQVSLDFWSYRAIRLKIFVRPDMLEDPYISSFPDASKIINNRVSLDWTKSELFNLLWQYLGNAENGGREFREGCAKHFRNEWKKHSSFDVWMIPEEMRKDESVQREIFHALAGKWMGTNAKNGFPYTWLPNHLGDSYGKVSPRSFLTALHEAANNDNLSKEYLYALHYQAIKKGVQKASQIRVEELKEDYRWIEILMSSLKGVNVPCDFKEITNIWDSNTIVDKLEGMNDEGVRLPPSRLKEGYLGIKHNLIDLGIFQEMRDGRINMPDVYRVGYGLGRKGGVKPVR